jgi:hypothetical protein
MGMFREPGSQEIDLVKEMAESLGGTGSKLEDLLEKANAALVRLQGLLVVNETGSSEGCPRNLDLINECIREYNHLIDQAQNALAWLLIQREACGFRTHRNVSHFYPIPPKMKLLRP